ncbi:hypothetical protein QT397_18030 [Microbulbifer sp. MKSA007]|nr:hypothetical protein QT397_18030 [Microbulbifer sp. MKSA007]
MKGAKLLGQVIKETSPVKFDQAWVACGTGATFAGLIAGLERIPVVGVEVLKAGGSIQSSASLWLDQLGGTSTSLLDREIAHDVSRQNLAIGSGFTLLGGFTVGDTGSSQ